MFLELTIYDDNAIEITDLDQITYKQIEEWKSFALNLISDEPPLDEDHVFLFVVDEDEWKLGRWEDEIITVCNGELDS